MKRRKGHFGVLLVCVIFIALAAFLIHDSKTNLEVTEYKLSFSDLPESFSGFKVVQLSDLHGAMFGENNSELAAAVRAQSPDIIVLTGDFITDAGDLEAVDSLVRQLVGICDVYFISGNHDFGSGEIAALSEILESAGVKYLRNEYVVLEKDGEHIILAGVEDPNSWADMVEPDEFVYGIRAKYPHDFILLLGHRNYWAQEYPSLPVDLILCGHTHGGIVRLPFVGGLLDTDRTFFPEYDAGLFTTDSYKMIISRGLGNSVSVPRVLNRPEIVSITLN